jgi:hypothetical protein
LSQLRPGMLRLVVSDSLHDVRLPKPMALKFERLEVRPAGPIPRVAVQAARLHRFRPDAAALFENLFDELLAEMVPPDER